MAELTKLKSTATIDEIMEVIHRDGAVVLKDMLSAREVDATLNEVRPYMEATRTGQDSFTGFNTTRTGALVARSAKCRELILNPTVLAATKAFLSPYCVRFQLHLGQIIRLKPKPR